MKSPFCSLQVVSELIALLCLYVSVYVSIVSEEGELRILLFCHLPSLLHVFFFEYLKLMKKIVIEYAFN